MRKARHIPWRKSLLLAVVVFTVGGSATVALASQEAWTVIFGTPSNDTINESAVTGNFRIYGFQGKDTLTGGKGESVLVGDGHCPAGTEKSTIQVIPPPQGDPENNADQYCDTDAQTGDGGDTLKGGTGNSAIIGGGGPNKLTGGSGDNYIQDGPSQDTIIGGPSSDAINATNGPSTITPGKSAAIDTVGPGLSVVNCPKGNNDFVLANKSDTIKGCAHVSYQSNTRRHVTKKQHKLAR